MKWRSNCLYGAFCLLVSDDGRAGLLNIRQDEGPQDIKWLPDCPDDDAKWIQASMFGPHIVLINDNGAAYLADWAKPGFSVDDLVALPPPGEPIPPAARAALPAPAAPPAAAPEAPPAAAPPAAAPEADDAAPSPRDTSSKGGRR